MKTIAAPAKLRRQSRLVHRTPPELLSSPARAGFRLAGAALAIAAAFMVSPGRALAQATGAQVIHGQASMVQQGNSLTITTQNGAGTNHSAINWQSFSVPAGSTTQFNQPNAASTSINRVLGNNPSAIYGTLSSNGRLVLVNPSGIAVGAGAVVDTAGFTASTLRMSNADALAGRLVFGGDSLGGGPLAVDGRILARSGDVVLIAPDVRVGSQALVQAPNGATLLAAGQKVELTGRGLEGIHFELQAPGDQAVNLGTLQGDAVGIFAGQLKHSGLIQASAASASGGRVVLKAVGGDSLADGRITALGAAGQGGSIDVLGQRVGLLAGASLDASGKSGGGRIRVGGDFQGKNAEVPNAQRTYVDANATLKADATVNGDGGRIIVWADDQTQSAGAISARGGAQGGDGGFVEVSGKHKLQFASPVDTRAPLGKIGTLLLDPDNISVQATGPDSAPVAFGDAPGTGMTVDVATINNANSTVILQANVDIDISAPIYMTNANAGITAQAGRYLSVFSPITTTGGAVLLSAGDTGASPLQSESALYVNANIDTTGGGTAPAGAAVTLRSRLSDVSGSSVYIASPITINAGTAGAVDISGQRVDISAAGITGGSITMSTADPSGSISLGGVSLDAKSGGISVGTSGADAPISISGSSLTASGAGGISVTSDAGSVDISSSSLTTTGGNVIVKAGQGTPVINYDAVTLWSSTMDAGAGTIQITGSTQEPSSYGVRLMDGISLTATGGTQVTGDNQYSSVSSAGGGIYFSCGDFCPGLLTGSGPLTLTGSTPFTYGYGVEIYNTQITRTGSVTVVGTAPGGYGIELSSAPISTGGGDLSVSSPDSVNVYGSSISTGGGNISVQAGQTSPSTSMDGVYLYNSPLDAGAGTILLKGSTQSPANWGINFNGDATLTAGGGTTVIGTNTGTGLYSGSGGVRLPEDAYMTVSGALTVTGTAGDPGGTGIVSNWTYLNTDSSVNLTGNGGYLGVDLYGPQISSSSGGLVVSGNSVNVDGATINIADNSSVSFGATGGNLDFNSSTVTTTGGPVAMSGDNVSMNWSGITTNGAAVSIGASNGDLSLNTTTISGSDIALASISGDLQVTSSSLVENTGSGLLSMSASGTAASPTRIIVDRTSTVRNTGGGDVQLSADLMTLDGSVDAGTARAVLTPFTSSRAISLGGVDDGTKLALSDANLNNITASTIVVGGGFTGGLVIEAPINITGGAALSLVQGSPATITQTPSATITASGLNADAGSVSLAEANAVQTLSGRAHDAIGTGFTFSNGGIADLTVGVLDGISGIVSQSSASLSGFGTLQLPNASTVGSLSWSGFTNATLGSGGGMISAGGAITADGNVALAGILAPGGVGGINTMTVAGNLQVMDGATMKFDFSGTSHDSVSVGGNVIFPSGGTGSSVTADASIQPPAGSYTLISGATSGDLPNLSGSVVGASLAYGSLVLNVASPPPPPSPSPSPSPSPPPPLSALDQIKLMVGDPSLPPFEDPVTTFLTLFTKAADEQAQDGNHASDNLVDDSQCRR